MNWRYLTSIRKKKWIIPKGFIDKLRTDGELNAAGIRARSGTDVGTMYTARADEEMLGYFDSHPFLAEAPEFSKVQTVARFSQGAPLYRVKLCAFIGASEEVVDRMAKLGLYLAKAYDGIMYDPQKSGFGPIDASAIVESASRFFKNVVALIECNAGQIIDQIVGGTDDNPE